MDHDQKVDLPSFRKKILLLVKYQLHQEMLVTNSYPCYYFNEITHSITPKGLIILVLLDFSNC